MGINYNWLKSGVIVDIYFNQRVVSKHFQVTEVDRRSYGTILIKGIGERSAWAINTNGWSALPQDRSLLKSSRWI